MNILDYAYVMAKRAGYLDIRFVGLLDGKMIFTPIDEPRYDGIVKCTGLPQFLVGTSKEDLHWEAELEYMSFASNDFYYQNEEDDEEDSTEEDEDDNHDEYGFLIDTDSYDFSGYDNYQFDPEWIHKQALLATFVYSKEAFDSPFCLEEKTPRSSLRAARKQTLACYVELIAGRLSKNSCSYLNYGPYWPALKKILISHKRLDSGSFDITLSLIYCGPNDLETLIKAEYFRKWLLTENPLGLDTWKLRNDSPQLWQLFDRQMENGNLDKHKLLGLDPEPTLEQQIAILFPVEGKVVSLGLFDGEPAFGFKIDGQIKDDIVVRGSSFETLEMVKGRRAKIIVRSLTGNHLTIFSDL